ncbi:alpha/beta fold hydrolase [Streptosporangium sp. CA-135522]|uniref:alpha/beta fold hydrolase n=1 Tax=Streptosporangium sp. CA-135522 TaxID=3240072 RepID=UPI003D8E4C0F
MIRSAIKVHTLAQGVPGAPFVVFAHGLEDSWTSWLPLAAELDPDWRLVALDLPWRPGNDYRWRTRPAGQWLGDGLDLLDTAPDAVVAHSFGANATLELLCALDSRPGRAAALVCPLYRLPRHPVTWRMFERSRSTFVQHIRDGLRARMGVRADSTEPGVLETMMDMALDRVGPSGFLTVFEQFAASADLPLGNVGLPTLVLAGGADPTLSLEAATALADGIPGADLRIHHDYDHFCHIRHARGVAAQVANLVDVARATTRTVGEFR